MTCGIYLIEHIVTGRCYVGSAIDIERRTKFHRRKLSAGTHWARYLQRSWRKYGETAFRFVIAEVVEDANFLLPRERFWILRKDCVRNGFNTLEMPDRLSGYSHNDATRRKMSAAKKGRAIPSRRGVPLPEERRRILLAARLAWSPTPEQREALRAEQIARQTGTKRSDETKVRMSIAQRRVAAKGMRRHSLPVWSQEQRDLQAQRMRTRMAARLQNSEARERLTAQAIAMQHLGRTPEALAKRAESVRRKWSDPAYRRKQMAARSAMARS